MSLSFELRVPTPEEVQRSDIHEARQDWIVMDLLHGILHDLFLLVGPGDRFVQEIKCIPHTAERVAAILRLAGWLVLVEDTFSNCSLRLIVGLPTDERLAELIEQNEQMKAREYERRTRLKPEQTQTVTDGVAIQSGGNTVVTYEPAASEPAIIV